MFCSCEQSFLSLLYCSNHQDSQQTPLLREQVRNLESDEYSLSEDGNRKTARPGQWDVYTSVRNKTLFADGDSIIYNYLSIKLANYLQ
jgi:hypothetical protein